MLKHMLPAVIAALWVVAAPAPAAAGRCETGISASGRAANPMNYDPPRPYDMETEAKSRAIAAWQAAVRSGCPGFSATWQRASRRDVFCEGYAGGLSCEATAAPGRG